MIYREWVDFVMYANPNKIQTCEDRLETKNAVSPINKEQLKDISFLMSVSKQGLLLSKSIFLNENEEFEAMEVTENGIVTIWTNQRISKIVQKTTEGMIFLPRHPPDFEDGVNSSLQPINYPTPNKSGSTVQTINPDISKI
ncbi:MAG: hypothetical protein WAQ98_00520 [Blastocatellia bacterium]